MRSKLLTGIITLFLFLGGCSKNGERHYLNKSFNLVSYLEMNSPYDLRLSRKVIGFKKVTDNRGKELQIGDENSVECRINGKSRCIIFFLKQRIKSVDLFSIDFHVKVNTYATLKIERQDTRGVTKEIARLNLKSSNGYVSHHLKVNGSRGLLEGEISTFRFNFENPGIKKANTIRLKRVQFFLDKIVKREKLKAVDMVKTMEGGRNTFYRSIILSKNAVVSYFLEPSTGSKLTFYAKTLSGKGGTVYLKKEGKSKKSTISSIMVGNKWKYHEIPLASFAGQKIKISLEVGSENSVLAVSALYFSYNKEDSNKNVLFILFDALRQDALSLYGYEFPTTPALDKFASENIFFNRCFSSAPRTSWAVLGYLTSCWGPFDLGKGQFIPDKALLLPEILTQKGYITFGITGNTNASSSHNLAQGYDIFIDASQGAFTTVASAQELKKEVVDFIDKTKNKKFFIYAHFIQPHLPYCPTKESFNHFDQGYEGKINAMVNDKNSFLKHNWKDLTIQERQYIKALYDASIRDCDMAFKDIIVNLKRNRLRQRTMVIVLSDHGEYFGDHLGHKSYGQTLTCIGKSHPPFLFNTSIHVPLIMSIPGIKKIKVDENISSIDLFPTILDFLNIKQRPTQGISLMPYLYNRNFEEKRDRFIFSTYWNGERLAVSVIYKEFKMIRYYLLKSGSYISKEIEFFDLKKDPGERGISKNEEMKKLLEKEINRFLKYQFKYVEKHNLTPASLGMKRDNLKNLKSLGYIN